MKDSKSTTRRVFLLGVVALLSIVVVLLGRYFMRQQSQVGRFTTPTLPGWQFEIKRTPQEDVAFYDKGRMHITLRWSKINPSPRTVQDLQRIQNQNEHAILLLNKRLQIKTPQPQVTNAPTTFHGMPALLTTEVSHPNLLGQTTYIKILRFIDGTSYYTLGGSVEVLDDSTQVTARRAELDQAWTQMAETIVPSTE